MVDVRHSLFEPESLARALADMFGLPGLIRCRLWRRRLADIYLVHLSRQTFVLKVYRQGWRSKPEVEAELKFAAHLRERGIPGAAPAKPEVGVLTAPEGERYCVLYEFVGGKSLYEASTPDNTAKVGALTARIHDALDDFADTRRANWDAQTLLQRPIELLTPFLRRKDAAYLQETAAELTGRLDGLPEGYCHGSIEPGNIFLDTDGQCAVHDFDLCGFGPRAYDLATFLYECVSAGWAAGIGDAFLDGYGVEDRYFIRRLAPVRGIWSLGMIAASVDDLGHYELAHYYLRHHLTLIRRIMKQTAS